MHESTTGTRVSTYRERLSPSLWALFSAAVAAPMLALVVAPIDPTLALAVGVAAAAAIVGVLIACSPSIRIDERELRVGRAHIAREHVGTARALTGMAAREARGPGLHRDWWHLLRGGIDGVVIVEILDDDDPTPAWVFSSRTPERVVTILSHPHQ